MKFETPKMNISVFDVENVVTGASAPTAITNAQAAKDAVTSGANTVNADNIFEFSYN